MPVISDYAPRALECGDLSPLSAGDLSQSTFHSARILSQPPQHRRAGQFLERILSYPLRGRLRCAARRLDIAATAAAFRARLHLPIARKAMFAAFLTKFRSSTAARSMISSPSSNLLSAAIFSWTLSPQSKANAARRTELILSS